MKSRSMPRTSRMKVTGIGQSQNGMLSKESKSSRTLRRAKAVMSAKQKKGSD